MTNQEIGQLLSDQMSEFLNLKSRKPALIEPDVWDDENGVGYRPLDRWQDRRSIRWMD